MSCLSYHPYLQRDYPGYLLSRQQWSQGIFIKVTHFFKMLLSAALPLLTHKSAHGHRCMKPVPHDSEPCAVLQRVMGAAHSHWVHLELQGQPTALQSHTDPISHLGKHLRGAQDTSPTPRCRSAFPPLAIFHPRFKADFCNCLLCKIPLSFNLLTNDFSVPRPSCHPNTPRSHSPNPQKGFGPQGPPPLPPPPATAGPRPPPGPGRGGEEAAPIPNPARPRRRGAVGRGKSHSPPAPSPPRAPLVALTPRTPIRDGRKGERRGWGQRGSPGRRGYDSALGCDEVREGPLIKPCSRKALCLSFVFSGGFAYGLGSCFQCYGPRLSWP